MQKRRFKKDLKAKDAKGTFQYLILHVPRYRSSLECVGERGLPMICAVGHKHVLSCAMRRICESSVEMKRKLYLFCGSSDGSTEAHFDSGMTQLVNDRKF